MNEVTLPPSPNWYLSNILACAQDGTVAWGARNSIVVAHPQGDGKTVKYSLIDKAHADRVTSLAFSPKFGKDGKKLVVSGGDEHTVRIWNLETMSAVSSQAYMDTKQKVVGVDWSKCNPDLVCFVSSEGLLMSWTVSYNAGQQFSLGKVTATCLACSPHDPNIVAVGSKNGLVYIVNLQGNGSINYKLRGHDVEITSLSWCPTDVNILNDSGSRDMLLASGAKDRSVFIWRAGGDGRCQLEIPVSVKPLDSNQHRAKLGSSAGNWTAVCWAEPKLLLASSSWGELISWDFTMGTKNKPMCKLVHANHARGLFCIANVPCKVRTEEENWRESKPLIVWTLAQDRQVIRSSVTAVECKTEYSVPTQGGYVYCMAACPLDTSRIAFGVGDAMLRVWNLSEPHETSFDVSTLWQKVMGKVRSIAWHPEKENLLAFGTAEGRVGVWDTNTTKPPILLRHYHRHTVYSLGWGPNPVDKNFALYSCGDGELVYYVPEKATKETKSVIKKDCTEFAWKPDHSCVALGFEDGSISFLNRDLKEIGQPIYALKKSVQCLAWHPESTVTDLNLSPLRNYLATAINATTITIFDLSDLIDGIDSSREKSVEETSADSTVTQHKVVATLCGHAEKVVSLAWSSHFSGQLVSGSYDCTAQVWKVETQKLIATYTGHTAPVQSCMWSPLDPDYIITGSADFTIRVWKVSDQEVCIPTDKSQTKRVRTKKNNKNKKSAKSLASEAFEESSTTSANPTESSLSECTAACSIEEFPRSTVVQKSKNDRPKKSSYLSAYSKRMSDKSTYLKSLRNFVKNLDSQPAPSNGTSVEVDEDSEKPLSIFGASSEISTILDLEISSHIAQGQHHVTTEMSLWNNSLRKNLQEATREKRLNDFLVSLSSSLSMKTWQETCEAYATQLIFDSNPTKAVSYLLCIHKIHRAVEVFLDQKMYREAYVLARCKLDAEDEIFSKILQDWASNAAREGCFEDATQCYAKLGDFSKAAKFLGRRRDAESLEIAAEMGALSGEPGLSESLAEQALVAALHGADCAKARRLIEKFSHLRYREVQIEVFEEMKRALEETSGVSGTLEWLEGGTEYGMLETLRERCEKFSSHYGRLSQNPDGRAPENLATLWVNVSHELAIAAIAPTPEKRMAHVVSAVGAVSQYEVVHPKKSTEKSEGLLIRVLRALDPKSPLDEDSLYARNDLPVYKSLRAVLCHGLLNWLNDSGAKATASLDNVVGLVEKLLKDAIDRQTVKYWTATSEMNKLEASLASALGNSQKIEDEGEAKEDNTALLEQLDRIRSEKKRFIDERVCAPSPILLYSKAAELESVLPKGSFKDNFAKILLDTWSEAIS